MASHDCRSGCASGVRVDGSAWSRAVLVSALMLGGAASANAQWTVSFRIERIGLFGPDQTGAGGVQFSEIDEFTEPGFVAGFSNRYSTSGVANGVNTWAYNPITHSTVLTGLNTPAHVGTFGYQFGENDLQNPSGQVAGFTQRITGRSTENGANTWVYLPGTNAVVATGLTGVEYTGSTGYQFSGNDFQNGAGLVAGFSNRIAGSRSLNGANTWVYNPATNSTTVTGLQGAPYVGSLGNQFSENKFQSASGHVGGHSRRYTPSGSENGQNAWSFNPVANTTTRIGLAGSAYTGTAGYELATCSLQNSSGMVAGTTRLITAQTTSNGEHVWLYNPVTNLSVQAGLTTSAHTGTSGFQFSAANLLNDVGYLVGTSRRYIGLSTSNGQNSWFFNSSTGTTISIGLTGFAHTGTGGYQFSINNHQNAAGQVVGRSTRVTGVRSSNGENTWVFDPVTGTTLPTGLTGPEHTGSGGYQLSLNNFQSASGQLTGRSRRILGVNTNNGESTWVYLPGTNTTLQTGLTGAEFTGSAGFQDSTNRFQSAAGQVVGFSTRIQGVSSYNGQNVWVFNPGSSASQLIGLTTPAHTGSAGFQSTFLDFQSAAGVVVGSSRRIAGVSTDNGSNSWVYNPVSNVTVLAGLTDAAHTGSAGYQASTNSLLNGFGQLAGYSLRITGVNAIIGQDVWYYDPTTQISTAIIGSVRTSDNYAFSLPTILTESGFLLGHYLHFPGGVGAGEKRAFVYRPDLGMTDLGVLVDGGLTLAGWRTLQNPIFYDALSTIVGYGYVDGQTSGQSVFAMTVPAPGATLLLGLSGLLAWRRARRPELA